MLVYYSILYDCNVAYESVFSQVVLILAWRLAEFRLHSIISPAIKDRTIAMIQLASPLALQGLVKLKILVPYGNEKRLNDSGQDQPSYNVFNLQKRTKLICPLFCKIQECAQTCAEINYINSHLTCVCRHAECSINILRA